MSEKVFLKPNVVIEPLFDNWYAWSHLISPATAAMNIVGRHLAIMESYLSAPAVHAAAVQNPKFRGGPFMDLGGDRSPEVRELYDATIRRQEKAIAFVKAVKELERMLASEAKGCGLEGLYEKTPELLRGYVEYFYDRNNNPGYRFFEPLLYESALYNKSSQSIAMWITNNDERPFCLSTPRLADEKVVRLPIPFDHPGIDALARMKRVPRRLEEIRTLLGVGEEQRPLFDSFFTVKPMTAYKRYDGDKMRMRYFGHACILIETKDTTILVDPLISYYGYPSSVEHFSDADLPDVIDFVLITHNHQDHILFETLLPLRHKIRHLIVPKTNSGRLEDPDLKIMFNAIGFDNVVAIGEMETIRFNDVFIRGLPFTGEHCDLNILTKSCYMVGVGDFKLLFLADSRIHEPHLYRHIQKQTGNADVIFVGMECDGAPLSWLYGPLFTQKIAREHDQSRRLAGSDCKRALPLIEIFSPREAYVYAMGMEPWVEFISSVKYTDESNPIVQSSKFVDSCRERNVIAERLYGEKELLYDTTVTV